MRSIVLLSFFVNLSGSIYSQVYINDLFKLDTILFVENTTEETSGFDVKTAVHGRDLYFFSPGQKTEDHDTLFFKKMSFKDYKIKDVVAVVPELINRNYSSQEIYSFSVDDNSFHIQFSKFLTVHKLSDDHLIFQSFIPISIPFTYFKSYNGYYYFYNDYKNSELDDKWIYSLKYDLSNHKFINSYYFDFLHPEFCYFNPNNWIDFYNGSFVMSQTTEYKISILDSSLNLVRILERSHLKEWNFFKPTAVFDTLKNIPADPCGLRNSSPIISYLSRYIRKISRIEEVYFMNKNHLFVKWLPKEVADSALNDPKTIIEGYDIWNYKTGELKFASLKTKEFSQDEILSKDNFPIYLDDVKIIFLPEFDKLIILRFGGEYESYLGQSFGMLNNFENRFLKNNKEILQLYIYSFKLD